MKEMPSRKNKRGSHVSVVISFVVFITFLIFLFIIFEPSLSFSSSKKTTLNTAAASFENYLSSDLHTITAYLNNAPGGASCLDIRDLEAVDETGLASTNIFVKNSGGNQLDFEWVEAGTDLRVENTGGNRLFKIYLADSIISGETTYSGCQDILQDAYVVSVKKDRYVSEWKIINALSLYKTNYDQLRQNIGISAEEFGFDFIYANGTVVSTGNNEQILNIYTKKINVDYFDKNLNLNSGTVIVKIW